MPELLITGDKKNDFLFLLQFRLWQGHIAIYSLRRFFRRRLRGFFLLNRWFSSFFLPL